MPSPGLLLPALACPPWYCPGSSVPPLLLALASVFGALGIILAWLVCYQGSHFAGEPGPSAIKPVFPRASHQSWALKVHLWALRKLVPN